MTSTPSLASPWSPRGFASRRFLDLAPVALIAGAGAAAIALDTEQGQRSTHIFWLTLVLIESALALLFRRSHPVGALVSVLAAYLFVDYPLVTSAPLLLALLTVAMASGRGKALAATASSMLVVLATPIVHRDASKLALSALTTLALVLAAALGSYFSERRPTRTPAAARTESGESEAAAQQVNASAVVETDALTKRFGDTTVVNNVDLRVPRGTAFGYLGPNGAGKTTLIRMLLGLTRPTSGQMRLLGLPVPSRRRQALARVGAIVDEPRFHAHLSGRQNLWALAAAREPEAHERIEAALERVGLRERADDRVSKYSMGMRQRLGIAACLIADPELLILDEPMNGLDPAGMLEFRELIRSLVAEGRTVVLSSHLLDEVEKTCDAIAIVDRGNVVLQGRIDELVADTAATLRIECSAPARAALLLRLRADVASVREVGNELLIELAGEDPRAATAHIARVLLDSGFELYRLQLDHGSLEQRFLGITSRLGEAA